MLGLGKFQFTSSMGYYTATKKSPYEDDAAS